jgi:hypothetical protein
MPSRTGQHGPTCIVWASLTPFSPQRATGLLANVPAADPQQSLELMPGDVMVVDGAAAGRRRPGAQGFTILTPGPLPCRLPQAPIEYAEGRPTLLNPPG